MNLDLVDYGLGQLVVAAGSSVINFSTITLLVALGEVFCERSGVINIGAEGMMLVGAISGFVGSLVTGNPYVGLVAAAAFAGLFGLVTGVLVITLKLNQIIIGILIWLLGLGLSSFIFSDYFSTSFYSIQGLNPITVPFLGNIPILGTLLFDNNILVYLTWIMVPTLSLILFKTKTGLIIRATGENPRAVDSAGHNVYLIRYLSLLFASMMAGLAGAYIVLTVTFSFQQGITAGNGFVGVAIAIATGLNPAKAVGGSMLFAGAGAVATLIQLLGVRAIPNQFVLMLPYLITILFLIVFVRHVRPPKSLAVPYSREEK